MKLKIKRIYEKPQKEDGVRILVDRLWPRGLGKEDAQIDLWLKEIAPSDGLRKWFNHEPEKWDEFKRRYLEELGNKTQELETIRSYIKKGPCYSGFWSEGRKIQQCHGFDGISESRIACSPK